MPETESTPPVSVTQQSGVHIVEFTQNKILDAAIIAGIEQTITAMIEDQARIKLVLDFSNVDNLSSSALGMLVNIRKQILKTNGMLKLVNIKPHLYQVFEITNLNKQFDVRTSVEEAVAAMTAGPMMGR